MAELVYYTNPQSRGRIAHWMLEELEEPYDIVWTDYVTDMKSPQYLAINPMGKVPALTHKGAVITETSAICAYLAAAFPARKLSPAVGDPKLADYYRWLFFAAGPLEMAVTSKSQKWEVTEQASRSLGFGNYDATLNAVESAISKGPYICGEQFTAADVYLGSHLAFGMLFGTIEKRPVFAEYTERLRKRPAAVRANQINTEKIESEKK